jgi:hypothetical protein
MSLFSELIVRGRSVFQMNSAAETATGGVPDGTLRLYNDGTNSFLQIYSLATGTWDTLSPDAVAAALYAPIAADYLVGTANGTLTGEIVAGTAPAGELGGTWGAPTVDPTHGGSAHHDEAHTVPSHTGTPGGELGGTWTSPTVDPTHGGSAHHDESHTVVSHSDTSATGAELNTLTDGSNADALHAHAGFVKAHITGDVDRTDDTLANSITATVVANTNYLLVGSVELSFGATDDIKFQFSTPTGTADGAIELIQGGGGVLFTEASSGALIGAVSNAFYRLHALVRIGATGGTFALQHACNTDNAAETATIHAESGFVLIPLN